MNYRACATHANRRFTRADILRAAAGGGAWLLAGKPAIAQSPTENRMRTRAIPSTGEQLPVIGCGTWQGFDVGDDPAARKPLAAVLRTLFAAGGSVLDSSPMYGRSEAVTGDLLAETGTRAKAFLATKVWTRGREEGRRQIERSMTLMRTDRLDLLQVHNLSDWTVQLATLRELKASGRIRYLGVTHYTAGAYADLEAVMRGEALDFIQVNYSADDRAAEERILPLAADRGMAVLVNLPFGGGGLLRRVRAEPLPDWAAEAGCTTWAQLFLKFVLAHPAVTCVIPGTANPEHMAQNAQAGVGPPLDAAMKQRLVEDLAR